ncbi:MAG TPA: hypothetical protein VIJ29_00850 [Candidatus Paceibacterota bacterium]
MNTRKAKLHETIERLIAIHEDAAELRYWESIFDNLSDQEQEMVLSNLEHELAAVKEAQ